MNKITIIIPIVFALAIAGITIWMNIKLKFAKTQQEATNHAKSLIINFALVFGFCGYGYFLFNELTSPAPLDRQSLSLILLYSFSLAGLFFIWFMLRILSITKQLINLHERHLDICHKCDK